MSTKLKAGTSTSGAVLDADTTGILELQSGSTPTTAITIDTSQNVGIGTSSPATKLQVNSTADCVTIQSSAIAGYANVNFNNTVGTQMFGMGYANTSASVTAGTGYLYTGGATPITFFTNATERMRIASDGGLFIGATSSPTGSTGGAAFTASTNSRRILITATTSTSSNRLVEFENPNGTVGNISTSGSATTYATSSDYRLKENIAPMTGALNRVAALKPVTYQWKIDGSVGEGFIAHELQSVVPECVVGEKDAIETVDELDAEGKVIGIKEIPKYQGIDTSFLVATLTAAIQELNAKITSLEEQVLNLGVK